MKKIYTLILTIIMLGTIALATGMDIRGGESG